MQLEMPMYELVMEKIGKPIVYNICMLGVLIGITEMIDSQSLLKVLVKRIPPDFLEMNQRAFDIGMVLGSQYQHYPLR